MFTAIQFSRNLTSAGNDLMLVMVFPAQLEKDFLDCEFRIYLNGIVHEVNCSNISNLYPIKDCCLALISSRPSE